MWVGSLFLILFSPSKTWTRNTQHTEGHLQPAQTAMFERFKIRFIWNLFIHISDFILCPSTGDEFDLRQNDILHSPVYIPCRSLWPRGLKRGSMAARLLGLRVWIPVEAWISVSWECCVLLGRCLCDGWSLVQTSPTECGMTECNRGISQRRPTSTRIVEPWGEKSYLTTPCQL